MSHSYQKSRKALTEQSLVRPLYLFRHGLRFVQDYHHTYNTYVKQRWLGQDILSTFLQEFLAFSPDYYRNAIAQGSITVNGSPVSPDYTLKMNDCISHKVLRSEPPVFAKAIKIIHQDDKMLVVDKPASMPVHVSGNYLYNSLTNILRFEHGLQDIAAMHRLDRVTSGLVLMAKDKSLVQQFHQLNKEQTLKKEYLARVVGDFGEQEVKVNKAIECLCKKKGIFQAQEGEPQQGKEAITIFQRLWYHKPTNTSLLSCKPVTGKTHQIRVHLQSIGFPIINDYVYGGRFIGNFTNQLEVEQTEQQNKEEEVEDKPVKKVKMDFSQKEVEDSSNIFINQQNVSTESQSKKCMEIMLHSLRYTFQGKCFESDWPCWAEKEEKEEKEKEKEEKEE